MKRITIGNAILLAFFVLIVLGVFVAISISAGPVGFVLAFLLWLLPIIVGFRLAITRDRGLAVLLAVLLGWIGILIVLALPPKGRRCPQCDEIVRERAAVCKHCGAALSTSAVAAT